MSNSVSKSASVSTAIIKGLLYLLETQEPNGSFKSICSPEKNILRGIEYRATTFVTSLILTSIKEAQDSEIVETIGTRGVRFLLQEKSPEWTWNYWQRTSKDAAAMPYPDDLDDTFCALAAINLYQPESLDGGTFAHIAQTLTATEIEEGGPYNTWICSVDQRKIWKDVDPVVNSNVAYFLSLQEVTLPNLETFLQTIVEEKSYASNYYLSPLSILYFISRSCGSECRNKIKDFIVSSLKRKKWANPLEAAHLVCAGLRTGLTSSDVEPVLADIIAEMKKDHWDAYPLYRERSDGRKTYYAGSMALTSAFCIEALNLYRQSKQAAEVAKKVPKAEIRIGTNITKAVTAIFGKSGMIATNLEPVIRRVTTHDVGKQVTHLPYFFLRSLDQERSDISETTVVKLGTANLLGWLAYTIYDDILDEEGDPLLMPCANACLRELTGIYHDILPTQELSFFRNVMNRIEEANMWERQNCHIGSVRKIAAEMIPSYGSLDILAEKSFGHALAPLSILISLGYSSNSSESKHLQAFFKHYLIARQLNDDAHDWPEDLERGFINSVGAKVIAACSTKRSGSAVDREEDEKFLQETFWHESINVVARSVRMHLKKAEEALAKLKTVKNPDYFQSLLEPIRTATNKALEEQKQILGFLEQY